MRRDHESQEYYRMLSRDQVTFIVTQPHSNFFYIKRDPNFLKEQQRRAKWKQIKTPYIQIDMSYTDLRRRVRAGKKKWL